MTEIVNIYKEDKIYIAGHNGMVGSAIKRAFELSGYSNLVTRTRSELDLRSTKEVDDLYESEKPKTVILAAAKVGGIKANMSYPAEFLFDNLAIQNSIINGAYKIGVEKLVFLGSSCIYPRECPQPMKEEYLLTGKLEPTNEGYAVAKIVGLKMLEAYHHQYNFKSISLTPCNLYGPNDSFDLQHSHVLSALVKRFTDAVDGGKTSIELWGTGIARREFMHVDDVADATVYMMENHSDPQFINVGWGKDYSIKELAEMIATKVGFSGRIDWDASKPNGMLKKCLDISKIRSLGYAPKITLNEGLDQMIAIYKGLKAEGKAN